MADTKWSQFPSATPDSADEVVGLHAGGNARFSLANLVYAVRNGLGNIFQSKITANGILKGDGAGGVSAAVAGTDYATPSQIPTVPNAYASNPEMDGTASPGSSNDYARGDHVHPENPTNAKMAQLAYVETGTTASRNISAGEYFCWSGLLYRAKTAIPIGGTFTPNTNCEQTSVGDELEETHLNKVGVFTNVNDYDANNKFTAPCDGYLVVYAMSVGSYAMYYVTGPDEGYDVPLYIAGEQSFYVQNSLFIRKGMKIFKNATSGTWLARFFPLQ